MTLTFAAFDLDAIRVNDDFHVVSRNGMNLVTPGYAKWRWQVSERPLRSMLLDNDGRVLSSGLPKFGNFGEPSFDDHKEIIESEVASANTVVRFTHKYDGSLIIRSVIDDQVIFRTRGTIDGGDFGTLARTIAVRRYPALMDPSFLPDHSLHFELLSSNREHQIVIRYDTDDLVFLGGIDHATLRLLDHPTMFDLAQDNNLRLVDEVPVAATIDGILSQINDLVGMEGLVVRSEDGQTLSKIKAFSYLVAHRLRSKLTDEGVFDLCREHRVTSLAQYRKLMEQIGGDWEMFSNTEPIAEAYLQVAADTDRSFERLSVEVPQKLRQFDGDRKQFAVQYALRLDLADRSIAFAMAGGNTKNRDLYSDLLDLKIKAQLN